MRNSLFIFCQILAPKRLITQLIGQLAKSKTPWLKLILIKNFCRIYSINLNEAAQKDVTEYESFNDFFCRALEKQCRPIDSNKSSIVSPSDGTLSQFGSIKEGKLIQAKGQDFSCDALIGDSKIAAQFQHGEFATIYLSPSDYHRVHMPLPGQLTKIKFIPGNLFSVNATTANNIHKLYARNERACCFFDTPVGPVVIVMVGAMIVASIKTVWSGALISQNNQVLDLNYEDSQNTKKGEEIGRFEMGSTVIMLFPKNSITWNQGFKEGTQLKMGEKIAQIIQPQDSR